MNAFRLNKLKSLLPAALAVALTLACSRFPLGRGTPIPGPSTVAAAVTQTYTAGQGQAVVPTPASTESAEPTTPGSASATPAEPDTATPPKASPTAPAVEGARPPLAGGQPVNIVRVNMLTATAGWAIGHPANDPAEYVLRTADGGTTWVDVSPPIPFGTPWAATAFFLDADRAWVTFAEQGAPPLPATPAVVWRTADGGQTWNSGQPLNLSGVEHSSPSDLLFVDPLSGWLLTHVGVGMNHDYVMLFTTGDGGQTWERIADPLSTSPTNLPMSCTKSGLGFLNPEAGWVTGDCFGVAPGVYFHRTSDGGRNWQPQPLPPPSGAANLFTTETVGCGTYSLSTLPPQTVRVALLCQDFIDGDISVWLYRSTDLGQTWQSSLLPGRDVFFLDANQGWSVAEGDVNDPGAIRSLYQTTDGGQTWAEITTVTWGAQLDFVDPATGWALARSGEDIALVHSSNGGANWQLVEPSMAP